MISFWGGRSVFSTDFAIILRIMLYAASATVISLNTISSLLLLITFISISVLTSLMVISISHLVMYFAMMSDLGMPLSNIVVYCIHSVAPSAGDKKDILRIGSFLGNS